MNAVERLEAQLVILQKRVATLEAQLGPKAGGNVHDEAVARGVVIGFGGDWEAVRRGAKDVRSCLARACAVEALAVRGGWSQRRVAVVLGMSRTAVQESLRKLSGKLANLRRKGERLAG